MEIVVGPPRRARTTRPARRTVRSTPPEMVVVPARRAAKGLPEDPGRGDLEDHQHGLGGRGGARTVTGAGISDMREEEEVVRKWWVFSAFSGSWRRL